jgi:RimJ/RimL family protein N-acetyltransferase
MPPIPQLPRPLAGRDVQVRDAGERDIPEILIAYQDDPRLHFSLGEDRPPSGAELGRLADTEAGDRVAGARATLTIVEPGDDVCQGQIYLRDLDWDHHRAALGIWLAPAVRGRGLARAALGLAAAWLLRSTPLVRLEILTEPGNAPMLGAAQAAGFIHEGVLRGYHRVYRQRVDCAVLSLLASDL